jgi:hypothetical protein
MPLQATSGAASYDAFGGGVAAVPQYIEDVFSTWLYTGTGSELTITNGIDLAGKGGMVWLKPRGSSGRHMLWDTVRGVRKYVVSNLTDAQDTTVDAGNPTVNYGLYQYNNNGFTLGGNWIGENTSNVATASWTFRKQPKFFDVVTWTGDGTVGRTIPHSLGSTPGCIIVKCTNNTVGWAVWHRSGTQSNRFGAFLNTTAAYADTLTQLWGTAGGTPAMTSTSFSVGDAGSTNDYFNTYVAYVYAHDAGGFGLTGTDNVISCGSYTGNGSTVGPVVTLGYEPQWLLIKNSTGTGNWQIIDNMRGMPVGSADATLQANLNSAESSVDYVSPTATGFQITSGASDVNTSSSTYIYIAIRRGPMKVPTTGTSVFNTILQTPQSAGTVRTVGFPADLMLGTYRSAAVPTLVNTRLIGYANNSGASQNTPSIRTQSTGAEANRYPLFYDVWNTTAKDGDYIFGSNGVNWMFGRAPGFFDVVCYTGTGANRTIAHNLGVVPEMMIVKMRSGVEDWGVYTAATGNTGSLRLNTTGTLIVQSVVWNNTSPTASVFSVGTNSMVNANGSTYVAYLFASCPGVSKVFNFTGNGSSQTINCGFTGGARFVMIKRTDSTGDWYVWDSARGIVSGNDPRLSLNTTAAEVTTDDSVDTDSTGFVVNQVAATNVNVNAATYIFLAIA